MFRRPIRLMILLFCLCLSGFTVSAAAADISFVKVNGTEVRFPDAEPLIRNGRTLVPIRFIAEQLGHSVDWDQSSQTVRIGEDQILLSIGSDTAYVDGQPYPLDQPAILLTKDGKSRTFVPLRFVSEHLDCTVDWFEANRCIVINEYEQDGREVSFYERCKQSDLFYELKPFNPSADPEYESLLFLKTSLAEQTDEACLEADWYISRFLTRSKDKVFREIGMDIFIHLREPEFNARREIRTLLSTFYPTASEQVYDLLMKTLREEIFENGHTPIPTISGTVGFRYLDDREVSIWRNCYSLSTVIHIKDKGYYGNKKDPIPVTMEQLAFLIAEGASVHPSGAWWMETYRLNEW